MLKNLLSVKICGEIKYDIIGRNKLIPKASNIKLKNARIIKIKNFFFSSLFKILKIKVFISKI